jgi:NitT/TauT family transport system ATP-binding protein
VFIAQNAVSGLLISLASSVKITSYIVKFWVNPFSKGLWGLGQSPKVLPAEEEGKIMGEVLRLDDISLTYQAENGEVHAVNGVDFSINPGELVAIVGPSGCGKSSILSIIAGLERPSGGKVLLHGEEISGAGGQIGYMLQKDNLLEWRSIEGNVLLGLEIRGMLTPENIKYAKKLLETYGLLEFADKRPSQLSGGMRQRAALIRTLAARPELLLLDEAFSALDYQTRLSVTDDVYSILKKEGKTALIVTHDIPEGIYRKTYRQIMACP